MCGTIIYVSSESMNSHAKILVIMIMMNQNRVFNYDAMWAETKQLKKQCIKQINVGHQCNVSTQQFLILVLIQCLLRNILQSFCQTVPLFFSFIKYLCLYQLYFFIRCFSFQQCRMGICEFQHFPFAWKMLANIVYRNVAISN